MRQTDENPRALARMRDDLDRAAMLLDDLFHRRQAEPGAEALGAEQRLEDSASTSAGCPARYRRSPARSAVDATMRDDDATLADGAIGHRLGGIVDQVDDDAPQALGIKAQAMAGRAPSSRRRVMPSGSC